MSKLPVQTFSPNPRAGMVAITLGAIVVAASAYLLVARGERQMGWVAIGFGVFLAVWFGQPLWRRVPIVQFGDEGLWARLPHFGVVPWTAIASVRLVRGHGRAFLAVERTDDARAERPPAGWLRQLATIAGADDLAVPIDGLSATPEQIAAVAALALEHAHGASEASEPHPAIDRGW